MKKHGVILALGLLLATDANAQDWKSFAAAFPAFPCQDGWMGCLVDGARVDPEVGKDSAGRAMASDLRVSWFDLKATSTFSPFTSLSAYEAAPAVVVAAAEPVPEPDDGVADAAPEPVQRPQPSAESMAAQERADDAAAEADAARASQATADREAREAAAAQKQAALEEKKRRAEEAAAVREADELARRAQQQAGAAQASERAALERQAAEAKARADTAAKERLAAEEASRKAREADEAARRKAEEEDRKRQEADAARLAAEDSARQKAEADRRRQEELARQEADRKAAEDAKAAALAATQAATAAAAAEQARKAKEAEAARLAAAQPAPAPGTPPQPTPEPAPDSDAVAVVDTVAPPSAPVDDGTCADLTRLEPTALLGKLSDGQTSCLEGALAAAPKMTDKKKISLVLQANAWSKGDKNAWEQLVKRHLDEIDQSDPDLCYKYALHLSKMGPGRASGVIRWANVALENRTVWTGDTYTSRVYSLYKVRTAASQALWQDAENEHTKAPSDESRDKVDKYRNMTKVNAREWYEYARSSGKDASTALQICISAAGTADYCEAG